jgi:hypothetical protein
MLDNIGCIEVIVLRCAGSRSARTASQMNMDGACDHPEHHLTLDGRSRERTIQSLYDDREPFFNGFGSNHGPPPPIPSSLYRSPYAQTVESHESRTGQSHHGTHSARYRSPFAATSRRSHPRSIHSEPFSQGARPTSAVPSDAFQYGSGPIPTGPMFGSEKSFYQTRPPSAVVANAPGVDPAWLNELLTKAVKRGVEEVRRKEVAPPTHNPRTAEIETASQHPGAWPQSPISPGVPPAHPREQPHHSVENDQETIRGASQGSWGGQAIPITAKTQVVWDEEPGWDSPSRVGSAGRIEETPSDSWDTDETWATKKPNERIPNDRGRGSWEPIVGSEAASKPATSVQTRTRHRHRTGDDFSRKSRSKSRRRISRWEEAPKSSSEDGDGWTHIDATSDSLASWEISDDTLQPSQPHSQVRSSKSRSRSRRRSHYRKSHHGGRNSSRPLRRGADAYTASMFARPASPMNQVPTPTNMYTPSKYALDVSSRRASIYTEPVAAVIPSPSCASVVPGKSRKQSMATTCPPPAPYAMDPNPTAHGTVGGDCNDSRSLSSSSWSASGGNHASRHDMKAKSSRSASWSNDQKVRNMNTTWGSNLKKKAIWGDDEGWGNMDDQAEQPLEGRTNMDDRWGAKDDGWGTYDFSKGLKGEDKPSDTWSVEDNDWKTTKPNDTLWGGQEADWNPDSNREQPNTFPWDSNNTTWPPAPPKPTSRKSSPTLPTSKRHTNKSLARYRQLRSTSDLGPKSHWQFPPPPATSKHLHSINEDGPIPPEPLLKISSKQASEKGVEHQVRAGVGTQYGHVIGRPEYLDTLEKPFAVFRFKYRSRAILKGMFGDEVPDHGHLTKETKDSKVLNQKEKLKEVSKEELIAKMLRLERKLADKDGKRDGEEEKRADKGGKESRSTESVARDLTENWVKQHSRDPSEKGKSGKGQKKGGVDQGWGEAAADAGGWGNATW